MENTQGRPLKVLIVGAGIGGLAAGLALRQNGHEVTFFEASKFSNETGAAIHVTPNCNGLLRRLGVHLQDYGANECNGLALYAPPGPLVHSVDFRAAAGQWQAPWVLVHRARLHAALREHAVSETGKGKPCVLKLSSKIEKVDVENASITVNGEVFQGDLVIGADGVHSQCRKALDGGRGLVPFDVGHSMHRWLVPMEDLRDDPVTHRLIGPPGTMSMSFNGDMRIIWYPCNDNTMMNCGFIVPSHLVPRNEGDWNGAGDKDRMLEIASGYGPDLKAWLNKAPRESLKLWTLLDLPVLHTWTQGKLALLGDAAHPFLPHQAQGGAQAIEDAVSLATMLPLGTATDDIPERLQLYVKTRKPRADRIQHFTRLAGQPKPAPAASVKEFNDYNFGHDEYHNSSMVLKSHLWSKQQNRYRQPYGFGPAPGPRQPLNQIVSAIDGQYRIVRSVRFKTSRTYLQSLLPPCFTFSSRATVIQASLVCVSLKNMLWLGGGGYEFFGLYIHGIQYIKKDGSILNGTFLPLLFENLIDPIITGRDELGAPKVGCDINLEEESSSTTVRLSWRGAVFGEMRLPNGHIVSEGLPKPQPDQGHFMWRHMPAVGKPGVADAEYPVFDPFPEVLSNGVNKSEPAGHEPPLSAEVDGSTAGVNGADSTPIKTPETATFTFKALDWKQLPTLHNIASTLAEMPVYGIIESKVERIDGVPDLKSIHRLD